MEMSTVKTHGKVTGALSGWQLQENSEWVSRGSVETRLCECSLRGMRGSHHCHSAQRSALRAPATRRLLHFSAVERWARLNFATGQINEAPYQGASGGTLQGRRRQHRNFFFFFSSHRTGDVHSRPEIQWKRPTGGISFLNRQPMDICRSQKSQQVSAVDALGWRRTIGRFQKQSERLWFELFAKVAAGGLVLMRLWLLLFGPQETSGSGQSEASLADLC